MNISDEERLLYKALSNPVDFGLYYFDWKARDHQELTLRNIGDLNVLRWGRRAGKTDAMAILGIWYAFTHGADPDNSLVRPAVCLIAAPYEKQVTVFFKRIRELIALSPEISASVQYSTKNPEYIQFYNGASIAGFTTGSRAGQEGGSLRGQRADWLILDELDYMTEGDIISIFAIAADKQDGNDDHVVRIIASSTPTGKRSKFWEFCKNAQTDITTGIYKEKVTPGKYVGSDWTEFYFPSTVAEWWQKDPEGNERRWRTNLGDAGYEHEILAEFGSETAGVFDKSLIDRAKKRYNYDNFSKNDNIRVMGVDWDVAQATPTLMCVEYCPNETNSDGNYGMLKVINRMNISRTDLVLDAAVKEIVEWNYRYQPDFIYCDRGYGQGQIEQLHSLGRDAEPGEKAYLLNKRVVGVSFSEKRQVIDPGTGEVTKKDVKPWMVTQTVVCFEQNRLIINAEDEVLWKQLENYRVEKVSVDGRPTYTSVNEHSVDSLMLCVLAINDKFPDIISFVKRFEVARKMATAKSIYNPVIDLHRINEKGNEEFLDTSKVPGESYLVNDLKNNHSRRDSLEIYRQSPFYPRGRKTSKISRKNF